MSFLVKKSAWKVLNISFLGERFKTSIYEKTFVRQRKKNKTFRRGRTHINHGNTESVLSGETPGTATD